MRVVEDWLCLWKDVRLVVSEATDLSKQYYSYGVPGTESSSSLISARRGNCFCKPQPLRERLSPRYNTAVRFERRWAHLTGAEWV